MKKEVLMKTLWGDFFFDPKAKRVFKKTSSNSGESLTMFAQFILKPIWDVYTAVLIKPDQDKLTKILTTLKHLNISERELAKPDKRIGLQAILRPWWPIAKCILGTSIFNKALLTLQRHYC